MTNCCAIPIPTPTWNGFGNITNEPLFVDWLNGNLRLQSNSPCINAGANIYVSTFLDVEGSHRIVDGTVDMGAYEYQSPQLPAYLDWLSHFGLPSDGSVDVADSDGDGLNNWQEWRCGTDPTNALSVLRLLGPSRATTNTVVSWHSVAGVSYFLDWSTNLPLFTPLASNIVGQAGTTTYTDTNALARPRFYRVGVSGP